MERIKSSLKAGESIATFWTVKEGNVLRNLKGNKVITIEKHNYRTNKTTIRVEEEGAEAGYEVVWQFLTWRQIIQKFPIAINN